MLLTRLLPSRVQSPTLRLATHNQKEGDGVKIAKIDFGNGPVEPPTSPSALHLDNLAFKETGPSTTWLLTPRLFGSDTAGAYPLILTTYNIVCSAGYDEGTSALVKAHEHRSGEPER